MIATIAAATTPISNMRFTMVSASHVSTGERHTPDDAHPSPETLSCADFGVGCDAEQRFPRRTRPHRGITGPLRLRRAKRVGSTCARIAAIGIVLRAGGGDVSDRHEQLSVSRRGRLRRDHVILLL